MYYLCMFTLYYREIAKLRSEEKKAMAEMKKLAKDKRIEATKILAKQVKHM